MIKTIYTIQRTLEGKRSFYGPIHGSQDCYVTICGVCVEPKKWWIHANNCDGEITCTKCLKILKGNVNLERK